MHRTRRRGLRHRETARSQHLGRGLALARFTGPLAARNHQVLHLGAGSIGGDLHLVADRRDASFCQGAGPVQRAGHRADVGRRRSGDVGSLSDGGEVVRERRVHREIAPLRDLHRVGDQVAGQSRRFVRSFLHGERPRSQNIRRGLAFAGLATPVLPWDHGVLQLAAGSRVRVDLHLITDRRDIAFQHGAVPAELAANRPRAFERRRPRNIAGTDDLGEVVLEGGRSRGVALLGHLDRVADQITRNRGGRRGGLFHGEGPRGQYPGHGIAASRCADAVQARHGLVQHGSRSTDVRVDLHQEHHRGNFALGQSSGPFDRVVGSYCALVHGDRSGDQLRSGHCGKVVGEGRVHGSVAGLRNRDLEHDGIARGSRLEVDELLHLESARRGNRRRGFAFAGLATSFGARDHQVLGLGRRLHVGFDLHLVADRGDLALGQSSGPVQGAAQAPLVGGGGAGHVIGGADLGQVVGEGSIRGELPGLADLHRVRDHISGRSSRFVHGLLDEVAQGDLGFGAAVARFAGAFVAGQHGVPDARRFFDLRIDPHFVADRGDLAFGQSARPVHRVVGGDPAFVRSRGARHIGCAGDLGEIVGEGGVDRRIAPLGDLHGVRQHVTGCGFAAVHRLDDAEAARRADFGGDFALARLADAPVSGDHCVLDRGRSGDVVLHLHLIGHRRHFALGQGRGPVHRVVRSDRALVRSCRTSHITGAGHLGQVVDERGVDRRVAGLGDLDGIGDDLTGFGGLLVRGLFQGVRASFRHRGHRGALAGLADTPVPGQHCVPDFARRREVCLDLQFVGDHRSFADAQIAGPTQQVVWGDGALVRGRRAHFVVGARDRAQVVLE